MLENKIENCQLLSIFNYKNLSVVIVIFTIEIMYNINYKNARSMSEKKLRNLYLVGTTQYGSHEDKRKQTLKKTKSTTNNDGK